MNQLRVLFACTTVLWLALAATPAWAQSSEGGEVMVSPQMVEGADPVSAEAPSWGTNHFTVVNMGAAAFSPRDAGTWRYNGVGYLYHSSGDNFLWAPVVLPVGAYLDGMRIFYYDNNGGAGLRSYFTRYYGDAGYQDIASWNSAGAPGYDSQYVVIDHTIHYVDPSDGEQSYNVIVQSQASGSSLMFKGVRLVYYLQVSPAPASATFNDVPTGHPFFQYVEALAASGITAGCGNGNYCPDSPVTRGQMAVFLAKALGLQWSQ